LKFSRKGISSGRTIVKLRGYGVEDVLGDAAVEAIVDPVFFLRTEVPRIPVMGADDFHTSIFFRSSLRRWSSSSAILALLSASFTLSLSAISNLFSSSIMISW